MKIILFLFVCIIVNGQTKNDFKINEQNLLKKNIVNKTFIYGKWNENEGTETHLTYLGEVKTKNGVVYKIMTSIWYWGSSHRATSRILIFNNKNKYYGNYSLGMTYEIPDELKNGNLIYSFDRMDNCSEISNTIINLNDGLPKEIFIKCKNGIGDFHSLEIETK
jgi:hypothetical protein